VRTSASEASQRYPAAVIVMHWAIAAAVVGLMVLGWWMQTIPKQPVGPRAADRIDQFLTPDYWVHRSARLREFFPSSGMAILSASRPWDYPALPSIRARVKTGQ